MKWRWGLHQQSVFISLTKAIAETAFPQLTDAKREFVLETDASDHGLEAVLIQKRNGVLKLAAFSSHISAAGGRKIFS